MNLMNTREATTSNSILSKTSVRSRSNKNIFSEPLKTIFDKSTIKAKLLHELKPFLTPFMCSYRNTIFTQQASLSWIEKWKNILYQIAEKPVRLQATISQNSTY